MKVEELIERLEMCNKSADVKFSADGADGLVTVCTVITTLKDVAILSDQPLSIAKIATKL